jgi:cyanophycin synthetase
MEFRKVLALRGPNYWARFPVLEAWVDLGDLRDSASDELPGFNERLKSWLPTLIEHRCSIGHRGGFFERLRRGTYQAHIMEHVAIELQCLAGCDVSFGRTRETAEDGVYRVALEYIEEDVGRRSFELARDLCLAAVYDRPFDVAAAVKELRTLYEQVRLGPSTASIVRAAVARGIPTRRLNRGSLVQLGYGAKLRRILAAETDRTGAIAESIAQDKELTRSFLRAAGVPVPEGRPVESADDAVRAAEEIGFPVVVKPQFGNQGRGVATNLKTADEVRAAYTAARLEEPTVVIEKHASGGDYRLLVVGDRVVAAARREPAQVIGDGVHTIKELIGVANQDPRRGEDHATCLSKIPLDAVSLSVVASQGYTPQSIPEAGARILIRRNANLSTGGTATDVTGDVHSLVAARAIDAARIVGLDIAGVDVVASDISRPLEEQGGVVVEVNAGPGLRMHLEPSAGTPRDVGKAIVDLLFANGETGRIPIVAVTGVNGKTTTTRLIAHLISQTYKNVAYTCTDGIYVGSRRIEAGDCSGPQSAGNVLLNPQVEAAVLETARGGILRAGLAFDTCDVSVVTNIGEGDHLGLGDIESLEKLARVKRTVADATHPQGTAVLNATDPLVVEMAESCPGSVLFFARSPDHAVLVQHRNRGGRAVTVYEGDIVLCEGQHHAVLAPLARVPITHGGRVAFQVENVLAAVAAAWSLGIPREAIRDGLETLGADMKSMPGRFNLLDIHEATVIVDYGHNVSSLKSLIETIEQLPHQRRLAVYTAAGDRRDCDMIQQGELLGRTFDELYLYEDQYMRGRKEGEIIQLLRKGVAVAGRPCAVKEFKGVFPAIEKALDSLSPGSLLLLQCDTVDESVAFVQQYIQKRGTGREIALADALAAVGSEGVPAASERFDAEESEPVSMISNGRKGRGAAVGGHVEEWAAVPVVD